MTDQSTTRTDKHLADGNGYVGARLVHADFARTLDEAGRARAMGQTICHDDPKWKAKQAKN